MTDISNFGFTTTSTDTKKVLDIVEDSQEIHIRVKKRNGKKCTTTIENLNVLNNDPAYWETLFKYFRTTLCCNGSLDKDEKSMLLFGDQREKVKKYLLDKKLCTATNLKIHGF